jgi:prophage regulatory protein
MEKLYRLPRVEEIVGLKRSAIYQRISAGKFPKPVSLGDRAVAWRGNDLKEWVEGRPIVSRGRAAA